MIETTGMPRTGDSTLQGTPNGRDHEGPFAMTLHPWFVLALVDGVAITHVNQDDFMFLDDHLKGDPVTQGYGNSMQTG